MEEPLFTSSVKFPTYALKSDKDDKFILTHLVDGINVLYTVKNQIVSRHFQDDDIRNPLSFDFDDNYMNELGWAYQVAKMLDFPKRVDIVGRMDTTTAWFYPTDVMIDQESVLIFDQMYALIEAVYPKDRLPDVTHVGKLPSDLMDSDDVYGLNSRFRYQG